jgi:hypothetical protein
MTSIQSIYDLYRKLRREGMAPVKALEFVREDIERLNTMLRAELVKMVRDWETRHQQDGTRSTAGQAASSSEVLARETAQSPDSTVLLESDEAPGDNAWFGPDSTLILIVRDSDTAFRLNPQQLDHDAVIGRSADTFAVLPDIDLLGQQAAQKGVSRGHAAVRYDVQRAMLHIVDLDSANGTFINNQRLYPKEVRALRSGDELRLGRLALQVHFQH